MYGFFHYNKVTKEDAIQRQEEVFELIIKEQVSTDKGAKYLAPYRYDRKKGCVFKYIDNILYFCDFTLSHPKLNCIDLVCKTLNLDYNKALEYIGSNLGKSDNASLKPQITSSYTNSNNVIYTNQNLPRKISSNETIKYIKKEFNLKDKEFWSKYEISKNNLIEDKVYSISHYLAKNKNNEYFTIYSKEYMYCYTDFKDEHVKIYKPYGDKFSKWFTNCTKNDVGGYEKLPESSDMLIITKSYKDYRVIKNQGYNVVWFQNEGMIPSPVIIKDLIERFSNIYIWFDNDEPGINNGTAICNYISKFKSESQSVKLVYLPIELYDKNIKDASDYIASYGKKELNQIINKIFYE